MSNLNPPPDQDFMYATQTISVNSMSLSLHYHFTTGLALES